MSEYLHGNPKFTLVIEVEIEADPVWLGEHEDSGTVLQSLFFWAKSRLLTPDSSLPIGFKAPHRITEVLGVADPDAYALQRCGMEDNESNPIEEFLAGIHGNKGA